MVNPQDDFVNVGSDDPRLNALVESMMGTDVGKDRKTILTVEQALHVAIARSFADSFIVWKDQENEQGETERVMVEGPLQSVHVICDYLENTSVSIKGKGLEQLVSVLTARLSEQDESLAEKLRNKVTN